MASLPIRDQIADHLLTPKNATLVIIDYQPVQVESVHSMDHDRLVENIVRVARIAVTYGLPIVLSTVNVNSGKNQPTIPDLIDVLPPLAPIDRSTINAWEDQQFVAAVRATERRKLIMTALWTEACLSFPSLDAMREGYEIYPVVDAVGGTSLDAHEAALRRLSQAGAMQTTWAQLICELQRDWNRAETVPAFTDILFGKPPARLVNSSGKTT
jgi:nicotinamidase-related amidase